MWLIGHSTYCALVALYAKEHPAGINRMLLACPASPRRDPYYAQP
jgi:pimeloyl-ACP methyl ester carboxylesterase